MTDMPYLTVAEVESLGYSPRAVYGGKVYSFDDGFSEFVTHGSLSYGLALDQIKLKQLAPETDQ